MDSDIVASEATVLSRGGGLAGRYATALYARAEEVHALDTVVDQMRALGRLIDASSELRRLLGSPVFDLQLASTAVLAVLDGEGFGKVVHDFVGVVASNRRLPYLRAIVAAFALLVATRRGVITAHVTSARPLADDQVNRLRASLIKAGFGNVAIERAVDPSLLGGLVVKVGARLYDSSLRSRLQRLQHAMRGAA